LLVSSVFGGMFRAIGVVIRDQNTGVGLCVLAVLVDIQKIEFYPRKAARLA
jgi:hypothetical protein